MTSASNYSFKEQDFHIPIAFAFDKNYLIPAGACIYSLLESTAKANKKSVTPYTL
ncbi:putative lipopolysaccharide biosynthesis domain protein [Helicobacter pylori Hp A-11]|uniref:Putative lipopolysaccharide biosynthesis domain protein n=1 Tax=Helicobacter pylori Hp A-11 TaxID=992035 RepID=N4TM54_HELPX|nr:putative lipopolysaccharide biosynthesis domain protein [Helicobacter pylori Hp A-11]